VQKISRIRDELDDSVATDLHESEATTAVLPSFDSVNLLTQEDVRKLINNSKATSCCLDPITTSLLLSCIDPLIPVITKVINSSLESGYFPNEWKKAVVRPLLKKAGLKSVFKNLRPVSN